VEEPRPRPVSSRRRHKEKACPIVLLVLACCFLVFAVSGHDALAAESGQPKNVLVLYSFSERGLFDPFDRLKSAIRSRVNSPVNFYVHYMESQGLEDPIYEKSLSETLSREFSAVKLDLVIVAAYPALRFAVTHRDQIFSGVPVLFCYVHDGRLEGKQLWPGVTGVTISIGVHDTLGLALELHPGTHNVAIVTGTSEFERYWQAAVRNEFRPYASKMKLIEIVGLRNDEILKQVALLPAATVVLFQVMPRDSTQPEIGLYDTMGAIGQHFPTYCIFANYCVGRGGIGGSHSDYAEQTSETAKIAARLLSGEKAEDIPVAHGSAARANVDWRQLRRWHIPESALPSGTVVLYRQPTVWGQYQKYILGGVAVIILETLLIGGLLLQRARGRTATEDLKKVGGLLIHAQEEERANIARELHDDFGQRLAVQCVQLAQLEHMLPESHIAQRAHTLRMLAETQEISADMHSLSHQLHSSRLDIVGLVCALRGLCEEITSAYKIPIRFTEPEFPPALAKDVELCLFRVAQEALANVVKHSQASSACVELGANAHGVFLRISDAGNGFDPDVKPVGAGIGLISMRERLRLVGGSLSVRSELMRETEVLALVPLPSTNKERHIA
jgi:signal transduction histidine kinase